MPTASGPFSFSTRFQCAAMVSKAWSQETGWNSPSLSKRAVPHAHQRLGQPVRAVHDLGEEIALDAVEAAIDLRLHVAMRGDDAPVLDADHDAAAGAAEAARRLGPFEPELVAERDVLRLGGERDVPRRRPRRRAWALRKSRRERSMAGSSPFLDRLESGGRRGSRRARRRGAGLRCMPLDDLGLRTRFRV